MHCIVKFKMIYNEVPLYGEFVLDKFTLEKLSKLETTKFISLAINDDTEIKTTPAKLYQCLQVVTENQDVVEMFTKYNLKHGINPFTWSEIDGVTLLEYLQ